MAGFNFMNRFYYGKAGQADYTPEQLPTSRTALFFEVLRVRFTAIMGINLMYLLFCLPGLIWTGINVIVWTSMPEASEVMAVQGLLITYLMGMVPCLGLAGVGATGEMYVLRNWARDQHAFTTSDYKDAVKGNWRYGLITGLLNGVMLLVAAVCFNFYGNLAEQSFFWAVPQMLVVVLCATWWMMNMLMFPMMVTYEMKYKDLLRNCAIMAMARLPWSVLFLVGSFGVPVAIALVVPYGVYVMAIAYLVLGFGLTGLAYASYANACFDKYLNPRIDGAQVNRGLRAKDKGEDEGEDADLPV